MPPDFEWEIEQHTGPRRKISQGTTHASRWRRWLRRGAILFVLLFVIGLGIRTWVASRYNDVEKVEQTVRSIVELELKSINDGDTELFQTVQDPAEPIWQERQVNRYFSERADQFAPAPGLTPADQPWEIQQVRVLRFGARVELVRWFKEPTILPTEEHPEPAGGESPSALPFHTTWFYRLDEDGTWYHAPVPNDFPGIPHSWNGTRLDIHASEIEAASIEPAARDLVILVAQVCLWLGCPEDTHYTLRFEDAVIPQAQGAQWALPALYLTGLSENENARDAWERALQLWVLGAVAQAQVGENASGTSQRIIYQQLVARMGAELGLVDSVSPDTALLTHALRNHRPHSLRELWVAEYDPADPEESRLLEAEVAALLDFIASKRGSRRLFLLLPALGDHAQLGNALSEVFDLDLNNFTATWSDYLSDLTGATALMSRRSQEGVLVAGQPLPRPPTPVPPSVLPGEHIAFICDARIRMSSGDGGQLAPLPPSKNAPNTSTGLLMVAGC